MRKFTFITLMMIIGMSSVSFGNEKIYLCIPERGVDFGRTSDTIEKSVWSYYKWVVRTKDDNSEMVSVKRFGKDSFWCKVGEVIISGEYNTVRSGIGESIKGKNVLTCRQPHTKEEGGYTYFEFNLNLREMIFNSYWMNFDIGRMGFRYTGKCEEI
jgi:hypothetical protein